VFEILEHTADIGFRARAETLPALFGEAAAALMSIALESEGIEPLRAYPIAAGGEDRESLLVNWLSEVLYWLDGSQIALRKFEVDQVTSGSVTGKGWGEPYDPNRHRTKVIVKGVTYHQLRIEQDSQGWWAEVYLDI
jgi:SHS2 domain-containing protein